MSSEENFVHGNHYIEVKGCTLAVIVLVEELKILENCAPLHVFIYKGLQVIIPASLLVFYIFCILLTKI